MYSKQLQKYISAAAASRHHKVKKSGREQSIGLKSLSDRVANDILQKLWKTYISEENWSLFPHFVTEVDALMLKYGAHDSSQDEQSDEHSEEEEATPAQRSDRK